MFKENISILRLLNILPFIWLWLRFEAIYTGFEITIGANGTVWIPKLNIRPWYEWKVWSSIFKLVLIYSSNWTDWRVFGWLFFLFLWKVNCLITVKINALKIVRNFKQFYDLILKLNSIFFYLHYHDSTLCII